MPQVIAQAAESVDNLVLAALVATITYIVGPWITARQDGGTTREGYAWTSLRAEVEGLRTELRDLLQTVESQRVEINALEDERDTLRGQLTEARRTLAVAEVEVKQLQQRVDHLEATRN